MICVIRVLYLWCGVCGTGDGGWGSRKSFEFLGLKKAKGVDDSTSSPQPLFIIIAPQPQPLLLKEKGLLEVSAVVIERADILHNSDSSSTPNHLLK